MKKNLLVVFAAWLVSFAYKKNIPGDVNLEKKFFRWGEYYWIISLHETVYHKTMQGVTDAIKKLVTIYNKTVMIVETGYPWTTGNADNYNNIYSASDRAPGYTISVDDQYRYLKDLTQAVINGGGKGVQYWEPAWITSKLNDSWGVGSGWDNVTLFDFNENILKGADYMSWPYKF